MSKKLLVLILAGGAGTRVSDLYTTDEPVKAMLKIGNNRLIEESLNLFDDIDCELSVLSFPDPKYSSLEKLVENRGAKVMVQKAKHRDLPVILELPYILLWQYHFSKDSKYLKSFDSILTLPSDLILNSDDVKSVIDHHFNSINKKKRKITILSKLREPNDYGNHFYLDNSRVLEMKSIKEPLPNGWISATQSGLFIFNRALLKNPIPFFINLRMINAQIFLTNNSWQDYGTAEKIIEARTRQDNQQ